MIGLDPNVVVRYLTQDDPEQARVATELIEQLSEGEPGFISVISMVELHWVLLRAYRVERNAVATHLHGLLEAQQVKVQDSGLVRRALVQSQHGVDFADALIAEYGRRAGCTHTVTFDRGAASVDQMMRLT